MAIAHAGASSASSRSKVEVGDANRSSEALFDAARAAWDGGHQRGPIVSDLESALVFMRMDMENVPALWFNAAVERGAR